MILQRLLIAYKILQLESPSFAEHVTFLRCGLSGVKRAHQTQFRWASHVATIPDTRW